MYVPLFMAWVQVNLPPPPLPEKPLAEGSISGVTSLRGSPGKLANGSRVHVLVFTDAAVFTGAGFISAQLPGLGLNSA